MKRSIGILGVAVAALLYLSPPAFGQSGLGNTFDNTIPQIGGGSTFAGTESTTGSAGSLKSPATTGVTTITGPGAGTTRVLTIPDSNMTLGPAPSDTAYDATSWDNVTTIAPSKNAVRDKFESLSADNSTASHGVYKASGGTIENIVTVIDAHAASTTITLIPGICPTIHNTSQADSNIANTLPAVAEGLCFIGLVTTTEDDKTWRFTAASANTVCLNGTCGKDDIGFATTKVTKGAAFACIAQGTEWFCYTVGSNSTPNAGDL